MGHNTCKSMGRVLCVVRRHVPWKKVCQNFVQVTFIPTAHAQQSLVAKVNKSSDRSIHQGANIQVLRHTLFVLSHKLRKAKLKRVD